MQRPGRQPGSHEPLPDRERLMVDTNHILPILREQVERLPFSVFFRTRSAASGLRRLTRKYSPSTTASRYFANDLIGAVG